MHAVCPSSSDNLDAHRRCGQRSSALRYILSAHYRQGSAALWALGIGRMAEAYWQSARASSATVATANLGCPSALRGTLIGIKVHLFLRIIANARRHYGRQASAIWPSHIGSRPGPHRELVSCISCDNLDAHRRCGQRSSASRYILSAHYRQGSAALWALGIGRMAEAYWQSARASSATVATANLGCPSALRGTLIGIKVHLFLRIIANARRHYGRQASAIWPSHIGSRPGPHRELVSCISCDNLDAHRRCGQRSSASRYILSAHYRQGIMGAGHRPYLQRHIGSRPEPHRHR